MEWSVMNGARWLNRRDFLKRSVELAAIGALLMAPMPVMAQSKDTIKIGVLHSLSGWRSARPYSKIPC